MNAGSVRLLTFSGGVYGRFPHFVHLFIRSSLNADAPHSCQSTDDIWSQTVERRCGGITGLRTADVSTIIWILDIVMVCTCQRSFGSFRLCPRSLREQNMESWFCVTIRSFLMPQQRVGSVSVFPHDLRRATFFQSLFQ